ncbi:hypothetical protein HU675_0016130 [Bradyrhizobium septentrionale]|uniref:hypothetical protein n=1 Tax=Bradyrhizobium septentrionale TaxID=1404411 RepID=UPI001596FE58|nr:hypothetical protein [Bradyrhizobium septentrionale]UGY28157.1 hypothetical protein HU675_0016130 [Bradyrhizobium septentrionale]
MSASKLPRVTFDTNVCNVIHNPNRWPDQVDPGDARKIRAAIQDGRILGFISEASLFIEFLSFEDKLAYLAVAGTDKARPAPDPRAVARFEEVEKVGTRLLHAPLIGGEIFFEGFRWANDDVFSQGDRQSRFSDFCRPLRDLQKLKQYGEELEAKFPSNYHGTPMKGPATWVSAFKRASDAGEKIRSDVGPMIGEWCDGLIVGSHFAYGNDVFCTIDGGKGAGADSLLHHSNRAALGAQGIIVMTPAELVQKYGL